MSIDGFILFSTIGYKSNTNKIHVQGLNHNPVRYIFTTRELAGDISTVNALNFPTTVTWLYRLDKRCGADPGSSMFATNWDKDFENFRYSTVKPVISNHSKIDKTKVLETNGSLMKVESIAKCSFGAFCNTFDLHLAIIGLENQCFVFFLSGRLRQVLLYLKLLAESSMRTVSDILEHLLYKLNLALYVIQGTQ